MSTVETTALADELLAVARAECERWSVPGIAIGVLRDGAAEFVATGVASLETGFAVRPDTLFQAGSISKIVATTLVLQLLDAGRLALDTPIVTYLPDFQLADAAATRALTMRHLLTHTGGFFGDRGNDFANEYGGGDAALARSISSFATLRQYSPPGAYWAYNNNGFQLAGRVVEKLLGAPFETLVRERVFAPAGMARTTYFADDAITFPVATGHNLIAGEGNVVAHAWARPRCRNPQGGVVTCVGDLLRFASAHLNGGATAGGRVLSPESVAAMQTPQVEAIQAPHWGLGWWIDSVGGETVIGHGGVTNGFQAQLTLVPARGVAFALLSNGSQGGAAIRAIEGFLFQRCLGLTRSEPPSVALPAATLARLAGRYEGALARCTVALDAAGLLLTIEAINSFTGEIAAPASAHALPIGGLRFRFSEGVHAGALFDFVDDIASASAVPRYLRLDNRLLDRRA